MTSFKWFLVCWIYIITNNTHEYSERSLIHCLDFAYGKLIVYTKPELCVIISNAMKLLSCFQIRPLIIIFHTFNSMDLTDFHYIDFLVNSDTWHVLYECITLPKERFLWAMAKFSHWIFNLIFLWFVVCGNAELYVLYTCCRYCSQVICIKSK